MVMKDHSMLQAAHLRVSWDDRDEESMLTQVMNIASMEEAKDLIIALTMTGNLPVNMFRNMLSQGF